MIRKSRVPVVALLLAMALSIPMPLLAGGNIIGPVYAQRAATTVSFPLITVSSTTQALYSGATFPAGECKVSKDGGTFANCTNTPSEIATTSGVYRLALTSSEMAAENVIVKVSKGSAYEDLTILVKTKLALREVEVINSATTAVTIKGAGLGGYGLLIGMDTAGGTAAMFVDGTTNCASNCYGLVAQGEGAYPGAYLQGGTSGGAGLLVAGGANGYGIDTAGGTGDSSGIRSLGQGTGSGWLVVGGATGNGILAQGGATSGSGIYAQSQGGNSIGFRTLGFGTGAGASFTGGSGASTGLAATGNTGATFTSAAANGIGLSIVGTGTGSGFKSVSGTGYAMELSTGGSAGLYAAGATHGIQGSPDIYPVTLGTSVWAEVSGTEPSAGPTWGVTTYGQFLSLLTARFYNKVTQTATAQSIYKTGGVTVMATGTVSDDGVTQTKGEQR